MDAFIALRAALATLLDLDLESVETTVLAMVVAEIAPDLVEAAKLGWANLVLYFERHKLERVELQRVRKVRFLPINLPKKTE